MNDKTTIEYLVKMRDGLRQQLDATNEFLEALKPAGISDNLPDLDMIAWKPATGLRGAFEVGELKTNENNASFARLTEYLNRHNGKATISAYFVWKFTDSSGSVGRKPKNA